MNDAAKLRKDDTLQTNSSLSQTHTKATVVDTEDTPEAEAEVDSVVDTVENTPTVVNRKAASMKVQPSSSVSVTAAIKQVQTVVESQK